MPKKKSSKNGHFWTKTKGNPFGKKANLSPFSTSCFYSLERRFFALEYRKRHFRGLYCLKKKIENWPFLDQNHGLTPSENVNFSTFSTFCFYSPKSRFFVLEYRKSHFPGLYSRRKKSWKNGHFLTKTKSNPFGKMPVFRLFQLLVFIV